MKKPHGLTGRPGNRTGTGVYGPTTTLSVRFPDSLLADLRKEAEKSGYSTNAYIVLALHGTLRQR